MVCVWVCVCVSHALTLSFRWLHFFLSFFLHYSCFILSGLWNMESSGGKKPGQAGLGNIVFLGTVMKESSVLLIQVILTTYVWKSHARQIPMGLSGCRGWCRC
jgi:hypothetical protein